LIPKENNSLSFNDYRPISLCNLIYKVISKVISNRIKPFLERCISAEQLGFLKGRRIQDAIGAAHECIHSIKQKNLKALVMKLDLKKAFDSIDWEFLRLILHTVGFGDKFINWILSCVTSANFAVMINGEATSFFKSERGLRQGCPLSPYLFILIMEGLSLLLSKSFTDHHISGIKVSNCIKIVHLMFVDDVLLLTKADLAEWLVIQDVLQLFCSVSGLSINYSKSSVHYWGLTDAELLLLKDSIPFTFINLSEGFNYLGFQLKMGASSSGDWRWLVALFERRIGFWCNKWLSLGGRYILVKSVLESLVVFWMTLERIPNRIIIILRRLSFNFLWNGQVGKHRFHLCSWQTLSKPRKAGGWGLKNLSTFNSTLLASSFWRAVTHNSIWHRIINDKYLGSLPFLNWLRKPSFQLKRASPFWKGLVASSPVILHWLRWKPGSGKEILIGRDMILGLGDLSLLSPPLRSRLSSLNFSYLAQISGSTDALPLPDSWLGSDDLFLEGPIATEWNHYISALKSAGVSLSNQPDSLLWAGGDATGSISVKNLYAALLQQLILGADNSWFLQIWKWAVPLKLKLFIWLAGKEKILSWDVLQRRGWEGPGICLLCSQASEDIHHLLVHCFFTKEVWKRLLKHFSLSVSWSGTSLSDCFSLWSSQKSAPLCLAVHVCWQIWIERNKAIFEDRPPSLPVVVHRIMASFHWQPSTVKPFPLKACDFKMAEGYTLACFDGAALSNGLCCGAGGIFKNHPTRITKWFFNCGVGTNTKAELLGLWASLTLASFWSINHLHVLGDSRVIIDWITQKCKLHSVHIEGWKQKTLELSKHFTDINFLHISRSHNREADALSKRALNEVVGRLSVYHCDSGIESPISSINIFE
jgi:ribonuclease HI